jgi:hypothetical protein
MRHSSTGSNKAGVSFTGCVDAAMDTLLAAGQQAQAIFPLAEAASRHPASLADTTGYLPASWLNERHISGQTDWTSRNVRLDYAQQVGDAFVALLRGELLTTSKTSPVLPRLG